MKIQNKYFNLDIKWNKKYMMPAAILIVVLFVICRLAAGYNPHLRAIRGNYVAVSDGKAGSSAYVLYWCLHITGDTFNLFDGEAGNPGVEGKIVEVTDRVIKVNPTEYFEAVPDGWKRNNEGILILHYVKNGDKLTLKYENTELVLEKR